MTILFVLAVLLSGSLTAAQDDHIRNFQVVSQNDTHITFSWDIVDGYYSSSYISYFYLYYRHRSYTQGLYIPYSSATRIGATFRYTSSVGTFNNGPYVMWVWVYRPSLIPMNTYSKKTYVNIEKVIEHYVLELKVHLQPTQTCSDFLQQRPSTDANREVKWILHQSCSQCTSANDLSVQDDYFTCTTSDYVIFRAKLSTSEPSIDLTSLKANLANFLQDRETRIIVKKVEYLVKPGPCRLTVPHLDFPHCFNDTQGSVDNTPTQVAISIPPHDSTVTTIVAIMCGTMLILALSGCIVFLVVGIRKINHRRAKTAEVQATRDLEMTSEVLSRNTPLPRTRDHVYAIADVPSQRNPIASYSNGEVTYINCPY